MRSISLIHFRFIPSVLLLIFFSGFALGQNGTVEKIWEDGDPEFQNIIDGKDILVNEFISLKPISNIAGENDVLDIMLNGIIWRWPLGVIDINVPEDIDFRTVGGQALYMVTDARDKRVFEINAEKQQQVWSLAGPVWTGQLMPMALRRRAISRF